MLFLWSSCITADKYNKKRADPIAVKKLIKDVDFVQRNLYKRHPDFDYYTSKKVLDFKFDSLRKTITKPLTSHDFYLRIAPVLAAVHQGHMGMLPQPRRVNKERSEYLDDMGAAPLSQLQFVEIDGKIYVKYNNSDDTSLAVGDQLISINGLSVEKVKSMYFKTLTSDGYNKTGLNMFFARRLNTFYNEELGPIDSGKFEFLKPSGTYTTTIYRKSKDSEEKESTKKTKHIKVKESDTLDISKSDTLKTDSTLAKAKPKFTEKSIYGFDKMRNEYVRNLKFYEKDSSVAYLSISGFMEGKYKKAYQKLFDSIRDAESEFLILDLRDNPGGRAAEIVELFRYFTDTSFKMYSPTKVSSRTSMLRAGLYKRTPKLAWPFLTLFYPYYAIQRFVNTHKGKDGNLYYYGLSGTRWKTEKSTSFKGKVYLLVNEGSFSAACLFISRMTALPNVTIVGTETGGDFNGTVAGVLPVERLPNSKISWRLGLMHIRPINRTTLKGRGIIPDKEMGLTLSDLRSGKDSILDWVLSDIAQKEKVPIEK